MTTPGFTGLKPSSGEPALDLHGHARQSVANMKLEPQPANDKVSYPTSARAQKSQLPECHLHEIKEAAPHFQIFELKNWRQPSFFSFSGGIFCESVFGLRICFRNLFCNEATFHHYISRTAEQKQHQPMLAPDAMKPFIVLFVRVRHRDERSCHLQFSCVLDPGPLPHSKHAQFQIADNPTSVRKTPTQQK